MSDEFTPTPEPSGSLVPPIKHPPTALAAATPPPRPPVHPSSRHLEGPLARILSRVFDALDDIGDSIAEVAGLRPKPKVDNV